MPSLVAHQPDSLPCMAASTEHRHSVMCINCVCLFWTFGSSGVREWHPYLSTDRSSDWSRWPRCRAFDWVGHALLVRASLSSAASLRELLIIIAAILMATHASVKCVSIPAVMVLLDEGRDGDDARGNEGSARMHWYGSMVSIIIIIIVSRSNQQRVVDA